MQKMLHTAEEKFLVQLAKEYPTVAAASSEIINLQAILPAEAHGALYERPAR